MVGGGGGLYFATIPESACVVCLLLLKLGTDVFYFLYFTWEWATCAPRILFWREINDPRQSDPDAPE